jgi:hypothetical protein
MAFRRERARPIVHDVEVSESTRIEPVQPAPAAPEFEEASEILSAINRILNRRDV